MTGAPQALSELARFWPGGGRKRGTVAVALTGHLGDFLVATPMLGQLRRGLPRATIVWLAGGWNRAVAERYAWMADAIWTWAEDSPGQWRGERKWRVGPWGQLRIGRALRRAGVETLVTIGMESPWKRFLANAARPRLWVGRGDRRPPRVAVGIETRFFPYEKDTDEVEELLRLAEAAGAGRPKERDARPFWRVEQDEREMAGAFLERAGLGGGAPLAVISPGSGWSGKNWGGERFAEVAGQLRADGVRVAWAGTAGEAGLCPEGAPADAKWFGRLSLAELAAVLERAALWVGNDGGVMHLAEAVGCPTVSLWGPTNENKWGPRGERHARLRAAAACPGCRYWEWGGKCGQASHLCMDAIPVEAVSDAARAALERGRA